MDAQLENPNLKKKEDMRSPSLNNFVKDEIRPQKNCKESTKISSL